LCLREENLANRCFSKLRKQPQQELLSRPTKFVIFTTWIRPVQLYGSETWVVNKKEGKLVFERKVLRTICGLKVENRVCRRRYNFELKRQFHTPCVFNVVKTNSYSMLERNDQKTRRPATEGLIYNKTERNEAARKTKIQVGGWGEPLIVRAMRREKRYRENL
jgi:hypothetical protein